MPKWKWIERKRMICIVIDGKIWLRYKKLNSKLLTSNISTDQVDAFRSQQKSENHIAGKYINVDIGWLLNDFYNEIKDVYIVAPNGEKNMWRVKFKPQGVQSGSVIPMFKESKEERQNQIKIAQIYKNLKSTKTNLMKQVNRKTIEIARLSRGLNEKELSDKIKIEQGTLSKIENEELSIKHEVLKTIATVLKYPVEFFYEDIKILSPLVVHYRKRKRY